MAWFGLPSPSPNFNVILVATTIGIVLGGFIGSLLGNAHQARKILGKSLTRFAAIPEPELDDELEGATRTRYLNPGGAAVLAGAVLLYQLAMDASWVVFKRMPSPRWVSLAVGIAIALLIPLLMQWWHRTWITSRLERRFGTTVSP